MSAGAEFAIVLEPWVEWLCTCRAGGCHPVWQPTSKRRWHNRRTGHTVTELRRFEQYVMADMTSGTD